MNKSTTVPDRFREGTGMKAIVYTEYGSPDVLRIQEVKTPVLKSDEVLVRVHAASVNFGDLLARNFSAVRPRDFTMPMPLWLPARLSFGYSKPKKRILGSEYAGVVDTVGSDVTRFKPGDPVFGYRGQKMGTYTEYISVSEQANIAVKPENVSYEEAAVIPYGAITALNLLKRVGGGNGAAIPFSNRRVLVNGASGSIGSAAVQLAKHYGAEVTGVCGTPRLEFVQSLGADHVIDYSREDFTANGATYDLIFDILGKSSFSRCKNSLTPHGRYLLASFKTRQLLQMLWTSLPGRRSGKRVICALSSEHAEDMQMIRELVESGKITSLIDKRFPMEKAAEAHRYAESGSKRGNVVITIRSDSAT